MIFQVHHKDFQLKKTIFTLEVLRAQECSVTQNLKLLLYYHRLLPRELNWII